MKCHQVDYEIIGGDLQLVEVELDPNETVIAEAGAMNYKEDGIDFESKVRIENYNNHHSQRSFIIISHEPLYQLKFSKTIVLQHGNMEQLPHQGV